MDEQILYFIQQFTGLTWLDNFMIGLSWLGNNGVIWCIISTILLLRQKTRYNGLVCIVALLLSLIFCNLIIKNMIARPRPYDVLPWLQPLIPRLTDYSFPSGHASSSFAAAMALALSGMDKTWFISAFALAFLIGLSRLYVGVHYPSDMLGGIVLGHICGYLSWGIARYFSNKRL
ncbi:MAG: phosphatase PAP2 family protein [Clostridiales bacterium]|nr:phosphatase PAP2 family protein [Clostridiales bacterium]